MDYSVWELSVEVEMKRWSLSINEEALMDEAIIEAIVALFILFFIIYGLRHWAKIDHKHRKEKEKEVK